MPNTTYLASVVSGRWLPDLTPSPEAVCVAVSACGVQQGVLENKQTKQASREYTGQTKIKQVSLLQGFSKSLVS